jgi:hypothetical protein
MTDASNGLVATSDDDRLPVPKARVLPRVAKARPLALERIMPKAMLPDDPNERRVAVKEMANLTLLIIVNVLINAWAYDKLEGGIEHVFVAVMAFILTGSITGATSITIGTRTRSLPADLDPRSLPHLAYALMQMAENGLSDRDRPKVQRLIDDAARQIKAMTGSRPWTFATKATQDSTMAVRALEISRRVGDLKLAADPIGTEPGPLKGALRLTIPHMVAIMVDFGLDPGQFVDAPRVLPGMRSDRAAQLPAIDADARRLAAEWTTGDRISVPDLLRIDADKAAGPELDMLMRSWERARASSTSETIGEIDAAMAAGLRRICAVLNDALRARARTDRDSFVTQLRYLDAKHGVEPALSIVEPSERTTDGDVPTAVSA